MSASGAVIKLGGSVLTDKASGQPRVNATLLGALATELAEIAVRPLIIVHGAGSYGHPVVERTGIHRGLSDEESRLAMGEAQRLQYLLCAEVAARLLDAGLPVFPVQASASAILEHGKLVHWGHQGIEGLMTEGLVPLLYGVPAVDRARGCAILSGDVIATNVAAQFDIPLLVHATLTDGVFEADPATDPQAPRIARIDRHNWGAVRPLVGTSAATDVTGGMAAKIQTLLDLAQTGLHSRIVSAQIPGRITDAIQGRDVGTLICWESP
jgi:isopentenyl phosphate kinase